jgi:hypothetical protein
VGKASSEYFKFPYQIYSNSASYFSSITRAGTVRHIYPKYKGIHSHLTLRKRKHKFYAQTFHTLRGCLTITENEMFMLFGKHEGDGERIQLPLKIYFLWYKSVLSRVGCYE